MKKADIEIGGIYAAAPTYEWGTRYNNVQRAMKVEVLETGVASKRRSNVKDGVRVRVVVPIPGHSRWQADQITTLRTVEIRELWSTFEPRAKAAADETRRKEEEAEARANRLIEEITMALPEGFIIPEGALPRKTYSGLWTYRATLTHEQLVALLDAAAVNALDQTREGTA